MSKVLRRPMFRGGRIDSRGTGITSGLMDDTGYADGGRVGFFRGGIYSDPSYTNLYSPVAQFAMNISPTNTMMQQRQQRIREMEQRGDPLIDLFTPTAFQRLQREIELAKPRTEKQVEEAQQRGLDITRSKPFEISDESFPPRKTIEELNKGGTGTLGKSDIDLLNADEKEITKQAKLYEKLLGGEEARSQAAYDALLAAAPAFFKGRNLREAAPQVLESINKSGAFDKPRDIKQAAAQLAIQRRILIDKATAEEKQRLAVARIAAESREKGFTEELKQIKEITGRGAIDDEISFDFSKLRSNEFYQQIQNYKDGNQILIVDPKTGQRLYLKIKSTDPKNPNAPKGFERIGGNI